MRNQDVHRFSKAVSEIWLAETICESAANVVLDEQQIADTRQQVRQRLQYVKDAVADADLATTLGPEIERFESALAGDPLPKLSQRCDNLRGRLLDELHGELHVHVPREDARFLGQRIPFGAAVARSFPRAADDIAQAADCLAVQQPTACVFHLMRGMEAAVRKLASKLGVTITPQTTWRHLTGSMDSKISALPRITRKERAQKDRWESARINLHHLGSVIRNNTMHPAAFYTQEQARHIFFSAGVVLNDLRKL